MTSFTNLRGEEMKGEYVSIQEFKKLEEKVNKLLYVHELDHVLTCEEKKLVEEAERDIKVQKKENFAKVEEL